MIGQQTIWIILYGFLIPTTMGPNNFSSKLDETNDDNDPE